MLILGLLGMYFDAAVVFVTSQTLLLKQAMAILCSKLHNLRSSSPPERRRRVLKARILVSFIEVNVYVHCAGEPCLPDLLGQEEKRCVKQSVVQVIFSQINIFCQQLTQNTMTDLVSFTQNVPKLKTFKTCVLNFRSICVDLRKI